MAIQGRDIAATADELRTVKKKPQKTRSPSADKHPEHPEVIIGIGPSITVGVGSLDPNQTDAQTVKGGEEVDQASETYSNVNTGPVKASSAIASAARAGREAVCP